MKPEARSSLLLLFIVQLGLNTRGGIVSPIIALFIRGHGLTVTEIGLLGTVEMLGWLIFEPVTGVIADRVRKKLLVVFAIASSTLTYLAFPAASSLWHFALLIFARSSTMSFYAVSAKALIAELLPAEQRGKTYGRYTAAVETGAIAAPFLGGYMASAFGYVLPFFVSAALGGVSIGAAVLMKSEERNPQISAAVPAKGLDAIRTRSFLGILLVRMLYMANMVFRMNILAVYLHESPRFYATETEIGTFMSVNRFFVAISQLLLGPLADRTGTKTMITTSLASLGFSYLALNVISGIAPLLVLGGVQGICSAAADMSMMLHLMQVMPKQRTGLAMGIYSESENVGGILMSPLVGVAYDALGPAYTITMISGALLVNALTSSIVIQRRVETE